MTESIQLKHNDNATDWALTTERVPVFSVVRDNPARAAWDAADSHDEGAEAPPATITKTYDMPATPNAGLALRYLRKARENADMAASWLLELAIGVEGYDALVDELSRESDPDVALATMRNVIGFVAGKAMGGLGKA